MHSTARSVTLACEDTIATVTGMAGTYCWPLSGASYAFLPFSASVVHSLMHAHIVNSYLTLLSQILIADGLVMFCTVLQTAKVMTRMSCSSTWKWTRLFSLASPTRSASATKFPAVPMRRFARPSSIFLNKLITTHIIFSPVYVFTQRSTACIGHMNLWLDRAGFMVITDTAHYQ